MKLDETGQLVEPVVGDAELVKLDFDSSGISVHIKLSNREGVMMVLRIVGVHWFSFSTDCPQNVIDRIVVTQDLTQATALAPQHMRDTRWVREQEIPGQKGGPKPLKAIHIFPCAGPELTCIADDVIRVR